MSKQLFDSWPEQYNRWFTTPIGALVKEYEQNLILELLQPRTDEFILDAGCGTGVFTRAVIGQGAEVVGLDISAPMLKYARRILATAGFKPVIANMLALPFTDARFDKTLSVTALEFIEDARVAMRELFRVTRPGGYVVVATLNSLSPWAKRRRAEIHTQARSVFHHAVFRSPNQLRSLAPVEGTLRTAIHFATDADPFQVPTIENEGQKEGLDTGAFVIGRWQKP